MLTRVGNDFSLLWFSSLGRRVKVECIILFWEPYYYNNKTFVVVPAECDSILLPIVAAFLRLFDRTHIMHCASIQQDSLIHHVSRCGIHYSIKAGVSASKVTNIATGSRQFQLGLSRGTARILRLVVVIGQRTHITTRLLDSVLPSLELHHGLLHLDYSQSFNRSIQRMHRRRMQECVSHVCPFPLARLKQGSRGLGLYRSCQGNALAARKVPHACLFGRHGEQVCEIQTR
jgi:hypothetical protein